MKVYLSGPIAGLTFDEANGWRQEVTDAFAKVGITTLNPLRRRMFFNADDEDAANSAPNEIVQRDVGDVRAADLTLIYWTGMSLGTACELWECHREGKPVILVSSDPRITKHPWVQVCATRVFDNLREAVKYICVRWNDMDPDGLPEMWEEGGNG